jgi:hypothetical protein
MAMPIRLSIAGVASLIISRLCKGGLLHRSSRGRLLAASLDELVEFPPVTNPAWARSHATIA